MVWKEFGELRTLSCPSALHFQQAPLAVSNPWRDAIAVPADMGAHFTMISDYEFPKVAGGNMEAAFLRLP